MSNTANKAVLTLEDGRIHATTVVNGVQSIKQISPESLSRIIQEQTAMSTPILPGKNGVKLYSRKDSVEYIAYVTEPRMRTLYYRGEELHVPTPSLMWFIAVDNSRGDTPFIRNSQLFALSNEVLSENDRLYIAPFPNIYSNHAICWEGNLQSNIRSMLAAASVDSQFFAASFNNDLDENRINTDRFDEDADYDEDEDEDREYSSMPLYFHLRDTNATTFPTHVLRESDYTLRSGFERFIRETNNG